MVHPLGLFTSCPSWFPALLVFQQKPRKRITSITSSPVAWPLLNLLPPLCTCQIYPIKVLDGCSCYHTFSLFLFMRKFNKEKKPKQTKQNKKPKEENYSRFCCPWCLWLAPRSKSQTAAQPGQELPKRKCKGKKMLSWSGFLRQPWCHKAERCFHSLLAHRAEGTKLSCLLAEPIALLVQLHDLHCYCCLGSATSGIPLCLVAPKPASGLSCI